MLLFYVRHGDPIYNPDSLTELGKRQAEAVAKRLALFGINKIFSSTSQRAIETATPTSYLTKKEIIQLDFANESHAWNDFHIKDSTGSDTWFFSSKIGKKLIIDGEVDRYSPTWYECDVLKEYNYKKGIDRIYKNTDEWLGTLGYEHIDGTGKYRITAPNDERVALFAHQGFGMAFLSCLLDIPYLMMGSHFDISHSSITVIEFKNSGEYSMPQILTLSSDSHLYREGLPTNYNNRIRF